MKIALKPLDREEMKLVRDILSTPTNLTDSFAPITKLEVRAHRYSRRACGGTGLGQKLQSEAWRFNYSRQLKQPSEDLKIQLLKREWAAAKETLSSVFEDRGKRGKWIPYIPKLALPSRTPKVLICTPMDLAVWLLARATANGQLGKFVRCAMCRKVAIRSRAKYCSSACQRLVNVEKAFERSGSDFGAWLLGLPANKRLPMRLELLRRQARQPEQQPNK